MLFLRSLFTLCIVLGLFFSAQPSDASNNDMNMKRNKTYIVGTVESINLQGRSFTVLNSSGQKSVVSVNPATDFEIEVNKSIFSDDNVPFSELRVNDWVKVKIYNASNENNIADEVEIYRDQAVNK